MFDYDRIKSNTLNANVSSSSPFNSDKNHSSFLYRSHTWLFPCQYILLMLSVNIKFVGTYSMPSYSAIQVSNVGRGSGKLHQKVFYTEEVEPAQSV